MVFDKSAQESCGGRTDGPHPRGGGLAPMILAACACITGT